MNSIKPLAIVAVLGALGFGLYLKINDRPESAAPTEAAGTWDDAPKIEMGSLGDPSQGSESGIPPLPVGADPTAPAAVSIQGSAPPFGSSTTVPGEADPPVTSAPHAHEQLHAHQHTAKSDAHTAKSDPHTAKSDPHVHPSSGTTVDQQVPSETFDDAWKEAQALLASKNLTGALLLLSEWYKDTSLTPVEQDALVELLGQLAGSVIYSQEHHLEPPYVVKQGERLADIAKAYSVSETLLANINGIADPNQLQPGQQLKVVRGPFMAVVSVIDEEMTLVLDGRFAGRFKIGVGQGQQEVEGEYVVKNKSTNPTYYGRDRVVDADDPNNPLGEHWIGLAKPTEQGIAGPFGIHGTPSASSVNSQDPRGYIRLAPRDATHAYEILSVGSKVIVRK